MKDLISASLILFILLGGWIFFLHHTEQESQKMIQSIENDILPQIEQQQWEQAQAELDKLNQNWHHFRSTALYFFHTETINTIDYSMARSMKYTSAEDESNAAGELNSMIEQLVFLTSSQKFTFQNIF